MARAYFVSDIHIESPESARAQAFLAFLGRLSGRGDATHLYLLGDIFDLWVADHDFFVERYADIVDQIRRLSDEGVEIAYFEGNHDLHLKYFWADDLGLTVHPGPTYVELAGKTVRLEHGDQMDPDDTGYLFLRWFLRTAPIRLLLRHLPGGLISRIGERASSTSRKYTSETKSIDAATAVAKIRAHAEKAYRERPFDLIVSGHVHVRDDCEIEVDGAKCRSINLGTWLEQPCYLALDENGVQFHDIGDEMRQTPEEATGERLSSGT